MNLLSKRLATPLFFAWVLVIISLSLILASGLYSDDVQDFQMRQSLSSVSFWDYTYRLILGGFQSGRFTPLAHLFQGSMFSFCNTILTYKIIIFALNICAVYSFTVLLKRLGLQAWIPLSLLIFCALAQFYINYHDAYTSLHGMYPLLTVCIFSAISFFISFLDGGRPVAFVCAIFMTAVSTLFSEVGFIIFPVVGLLLLTDSRPIGRKALLLVPYATILIGYMIAVTTIRSGLQTVYTGVTVSPHPARMLSVVFFQLVATIPMTAYAYLGAIPQLLFHALILTWPLIALAIIAVALLQKGLARETLNSIDSNQKRRSLILGFALWILPAMTIMVSLKYQNEARFGAGYLPVYIQNFGLIILLILLFDKLFSRFPLKKGRILKLGGSFVFLLFLFTFLRNTHLLAQENSRRSTPGCYFFKSLKGGILNDCPDGSVIVLGSDYIYHAPFTYGVLMKNLYGKNFSVVSGYKFTGVPSGDNKLYYYLLQDEKVQSTILYKMTSDGQKQELKRINYPVDKDFSYFELISTPL